MIAKRQPLGCDLREIVAALRISIDLERIGDFAKNIGKRLSVLKDYLYPTRLTNGIQQMADVALLQFRNVLESYAHRDAAEAVAVWKGDEKIDPMYTSIFRELLTYMMEEPRSITFSTQVLFCAKNIERVGDHTTNVAETVHYMVAGVPLTSRRPKTDTATPSTAESRA